VVKRIVSASLDKTIKLWEVTTGQEIMTFKEHRDAVNHTSFSQSGNVMASGSGDGVVRLWTAATDMEVEAQRDKPDVTNRVTK
jgi:WD40 repeat protein